LNSPRLEADRYLTSSMMRSHATHTSSTYRPSRTAKNAELRADSIQALTVGRAVAKDARAVATAADAMVLVALQSDHPAP
jgi:hypothetical protein